MRNPLADKDREIDHGETAEGKYEDYCRKQAELARAPKNRAIEPQQTPASEPIPTPTATHPTATYTPLKYQQPPGPNYPPNTPPPYSTPLTTPPRMINLDEIISEEFKKGFNSIYTEEKLKKFKNPY